MNNPRAVLLEIRKKRELKIRTARELSAKATSLESIDEIQTKKWCGYLTLEFPYEVDITYRGLPYQDEFCDKNDIEIEFFRKYILKRASFIEKTIEYYEPVNKEIVHEIKKNNLASFLDTFSEADLISDEESIIELIRNDQRLGTGSKNTYISRFKKIVAYFNNKRYQTHQLHPNSQMVVVLAKYFDYMEQRCFWPKSQNPACNNPYRSLISVRLMFYVPLSYVELKGIRLEDIRCDSQKSSPEDTYSIFYKGDLYPVPKTFVELCKAVVPEDEALIEGNTMKGISQFISQTATSKSAGLGTKISFKIIKRSMRIILEKLHVNYRLLQRR